MAYELEIKDEMSELEKFVREEATKYLNSTMFLSCISSHHPNLDSVVEKGKDVVPYVVKLYRENGEYSPQNMYTHFFLLVMQNLYGNPFQGYVGMNFAIKYWLKRYDHNVLEYNKDTDRDKYNAFLLDFLDCKDMDELNKLKEELEAKDNEQTE